MTKEILKLMPETADVFQATVGFLHSVDEGEGVRFHTFPTAGSIGASEAEKLGCQKPMFGMS
jgi:hypothetical protein